MISVIKTVKVFDTNLVSEVISSKNLEEQQYHLKPLKILKYKGEHLSMYSATDAVSRHLNVKGLNNDVYHLAGNGGVPGTIKKHILDTWTIVILTKTRVQYRKCIKIMHNVITKLKFKFAIDKTFIGKITRWFKFWGQRFVGSGLKI